jgi:uncharacterized protein (UPF0335 family)
MESNDEILLFTDGAIETITGNHHSEIEAVKKKYENQIKNIKESNRVSVNKLNETHIQQIEEMNKKHLITVSNTITDTEINYKQELNKLRYDNTNLRAILSVRELDNKKLEEQVKIYNSYVLKYKIILNELDNLKVFEKTLRKELENAKVFEKTLRTELNRAMTKGKEAWDIFKQYCPQEYLKYINRYDDMKFIPKATEHYISYNMWNENHQTTNDNIKIW